MAMNMEDHPLRDKRLAAYIRISSDTQDAERQRGSITNWTATHGLTISKWFEDTSGRNPRDQADKRLKFQNLLSGVADGEFDAVVVDRQDRFGTKNSHEFGKYILQLTDFSCELWSVGQGNLSASDPATILTTTLSSITSTQEQEEKGYRSLSGKITHARAGEYPGGYPPYGLDVVCIGSDEEHKWRVVWVGNFKRLKIMPDGTERRYDGKNNFPAKDANDRLRYSPSVKLERLRVVREIFHWYAHESISPTQIATRLNDALVDSVFGEAWNKEKIKCLLKNPAYTGFPAVNKRAGGRFAEYVDGEIRKVKPSNGKIRAGRKRQACDHIRSDERVFDPIISDELYDRVQAKLKASSRKHTKPNRKPPRTASFWLRNILYCGKCMKPMRAWNQGYRSYFCATYGTYGKSNPTNCQCFRTKADVVEKIVEHYLAEADEKVGNILNAQVTKSTALLKPLEGELKETSQKIDDVYEQMHSKVTEFMAERGSETAMAGYRSFVEGTLTATERLRIERTPYSGLYIYVQQERVPNLRAELSRLDSEHSRLTERVLRLPETATGAIDKTNGQILALESRMHEIRCELDDLSCELHLLLGELAMRQRALQRAKEAIQDDSSHREKSELVGSVLEKVVCHFRDTNGRGNQPRTTLDSVEVFPVVGDPVLRFPNGNKPGTN